MASAAAPGSRRARRSSSSSSSRGSAEHLTQEGLERNAPPREGSPRVPDMERRGNLSMDRTSPVLNEAGDDCAAVDRALRRGILQGDGAALRAFHDAHARPLYAFCFYRVGRDHHAAEEVVQETL